MAFVSKSICLIVRVGRIELPPHPWQGRVLPLNDTRVKTILIENTEKSKCVVRPEGLEPPISVPKTGVISISLRARKDISIHMQRFSNVSE